MSGDDDAAVQDGVVAADETQVDRRGATGRALTGNTTPFFLLINPQMKTEIRIREKGLLYHSDSLCIITKHHQVSHIARVWWRSTEPVRL